MSSTRNPDWNGDLYETPCPFGIVKDLGFFFITGAFWGVVYNSIKGFRGSPYGEKLQGIRSTVRLHVPISAGRFAAWGALYHCFDCTIRYFRSIDDTWDSILAGSFASGSLAIRRGYKSFGRSFIIGGIALGVFDGMCRTMYRYTAEPLSQIQAPQNNKDLQHKKNKSLIFS